MRNRSPRNRFEGMDPEWLLKLFYCYIQWCIGELREDDRVELEALTPQLRAEFRVSGSSWYEVIEEAAGLATTGRAILAGSWREMRGEVSANEFVLEFVNQFIRKAGQHRRARRSLLARRRQKDH